MSDFSHFSEDLFGFLDELTLNNNREWFKAHKARYEREVRGPALDFIVAIGERLDQLSPHLVADARKSGGSMMRPYRDTRFSKDKTPYKTNVGIQFRHSAGKDVHAPGAYLHLGTEEFFVGVGMWRPESSALKAIRDAIDEQPERYQTIIDGFASELNRGGTSLKRAPRGFPKDHPLVEELKRKDHIAVCDVEPERLMAPGALDYVMGKFMAGQAYCKFLCDAIGQPF